MSSTHAAWHCSTVVAPATADPLGKSTSSAPCPSHQQFLPSIFSQATGTGDSGEGGGGEGGRGRGGSNGTGGGTASCLPSTMPAPPMMKYTVLMPLIMKSTTLIQISASARAQRYVPSRPSPHSMLGEDTSRAISSAGAALLLLPGTLWSSRARRTVESCVEVDLAPSA